MQALLSRVLLAVSQELLHPYADAHKSGTKCPFLHSFDGQPVFHSVKALVLMDLAASHFPDGMSKMRALLCQGACPNGFSCAAL